ncbi:MAG TPA: hypothetical protein VFB20_06000 [Burkholderiales bacterium]|nr:hypothetical protein [Burkholderiales bacterium]
MKRWTLLLSACLAFVACAATAQAEEDSGAKETARKAGRDIKEGGKKFGETAKDTGKKIGHSTADTVKSIKNKVGSDVKNKNFKPRPNGSVKEEPKSRK